jgi:dTDP-glucose 4,6-dehydratase
MIGAPQPVAGSGRREPDWTIVTPVFRVLAPAVVVSDRADGLNNYGPRQHPEKVVPRFITQALSGDALTIHGDGHASRDWLHVDDTASAIEALIDAPLERVAGEVVNVSTGIDISVLDIARLVLDVVGNPAATTVHVDERPGQVDRHIGSTERLAELTGWRASIGFEDGLERTVDWYRENEAWWRGVLGRVHVSSS